LRRLHTAVRFSAAGSLSHLQALKKLAEAAVRQYGLSFGPQRPDEVVPIMQRLIDKYPKSPIASAAQDHIDRARVLATHPADAHSPP